MLGIMAAAILSMSLSGRGIQSINDSALQKMTYKVRETAFNPYVTHGIYEDMKIVYKKGEEQTVLEAKDVVDWVRYWPDGHWDIDDDKIANYVAGLQKQYDTCAKERWFTTTMGERVLIKKGDYGWKLDRNTEVKEISHLLRNNGTTVHELHFLIEGPEEGDAEHPFGDTYIEIDLSRQVLWLYEKGNLSVVSHIVSGMMNTSRQTPGGAFVVKYKQSPAVLVGADYQTPVSYWMPFNGGIGLHDATWQPGFGGDACYYRGSHGCINLPLDIAGIIYEKIEKGFPVICYYSNPEDEQ